MRRHPTSHATLLAALGLAIAGFGFAPPGEPTPSADDARAFVEQANAELLELANHAARAAWVQQTYITEDTQALSARAQQALTARIMELAAESNRYAGLELPEELQRQLALMKVGITLPAPKDPALQAELVQTTTWLESEYGKGRYCPEGGECRDLGQLSKTIAESRDWDALVEAWRGWRTVSRPMRPKYARFVELSNAGARDLGFADTGALWRSGYDMPADAFAAELDRLWEQVKPLYESLHAYVRTRLVERYGSERVSADGLIPAHLLGNMWAQEWGFAYDLVAPGNSDPGYDLTALLAEKPVDALGMVKIGERFFTSLGFAPLPETFWKRSLFTQPADRDVVCHASAWDVDNDQDLRIKMCIKVDAEDFVTVHHELGHNFYQRAYASQPALFRNSANDGFHEAIGDAIALSVTPSYLVKIGLLEQEPQNADVIGLLLRQAMDKVAFLPFGLLVDQWRWKVFSGEVPPERYNAAWWELRGKVQGLAPPVARSEADFDPGAKYHVPANTPYTRYFLARILQFQFHRALCREAGYEGPLHGCSIYGNEAVGKKLAAMLETGQSRPWPDALEALTGERQMDATAILDYFAPLKVWLDEQNQGHPVGY